MSAWLKKIALFLLPVFTLVGYYAAMDPFRIIGELEDSKLGQIASSDDYYGVERFLKNIESGTTYNTYVFGNSKTLAFTPEDLCNSTTCSYYNFGAPGESIRNIHDKIKLVLDQGQELSEVLLVLDHKVLMNKNNAHDDFKGPVYEHHPAVSQNTWLSFHINFFKYFIRDFSFFDILRWHLLEDESRGIPGKISTRESVQSVVYDAQGNFAIRNSAEEKIENNPDQYFSNIQSEMKKRASKTYALKLSEKQVELLFGMNRMFEEHGTTYAVILGPYWQADLLKQQVLVTLSGIFGEVHVHDFTGRNEWNANINNWYESSHYRPKVGRAIIHQVNTNP